MATTSTYDVFIDCMDKDTRYSFVSHLYAAFRRRRISVFLSEQNTQPLVEGVKVFVVVISENYALSSQCLNTLMEFLERRRQKQDGLVVVPVYYGVTRLMVEEQTKKYKEIFSKHPKDQVAKWRKGLKETASLPGHDTTDDKQKKDSELVEEIVDDVREKLDPMGKIGIYSRLLDLESLLCKQSHSICRHLGIWGMPGIGKTAIAREAYKQMSYDFDDSCLVEDFHTSFHEKGMYQLREEQFKKDGEPTERTRFFEKVRGKKVLFVLDDVRNPMDAESFLGGFEGLLQGSLIIITSRDRQVLCQCQGEYVYEVPRLSEKEALRLFTRTALQGKEPSDSKLIELSKKIIEYANGNPLVLNSLSKALKEKKTPKEMEEDFEEMKRCLPNEMLSVFKISYDALSENERGIFLDIACFFKDEQLDQIIHILEGCGFFPHVGIDRLVELSLLTRSQKKKVEMHSLIQDVGRAFAKEDNKQLGRRRRLWEPSTIRPVLEDSKSKGTEVIEGIFLDTTNENFDVDPMAFENMYNLRLLKIYSSNSETAQGLHLPKKLDSLPYELRLLHWEKYPLPSLPQDFDSSHLVELNMPYSQLQNIREGIKSLPKLKIVNLSYSKKLVKVDELSKACSLVKIYLQGCTSLESIPHTNDLKNLQLLNLSGCTRIQREEITNKIKGLNTDGGLKETKSESMVFSTKVKVDR